MTISNTTRSLAMTRRLMLALCLCAGTAFALPPRGSGQLQIAGGSNGVLRLDGSVGWMTVESTERVYDDTIAPNYRLSQLDWEASSVVLAGVAASWQPGRLRLSASYWLSLAGDNGELTDTDWLWPDTPAWTDRSTADAELSVTLLDVNMAYTFYSTPDFASRLTAGVKQDTLEWESSGGDYIYTTVTFRDTIGAGDLGDIDYEQTIDAPYIGIEAVALVRQVEVAAYVLYSPIAKVDAVDTHYGDVGEEIHFEDDFTDVDYLAAGISAAMTVSGRTSLALSYDYLRLSEGRGDTYIPEIMTHFPNSAGTAMEAGTVSASVAICF